MEKSVKMNSLQMEKSVRMVNSLNIGKSLKMVNSVKKGNL